MVIICHRGDNNQKRFILDIIRKGIIIDTYKGGLLMLNGTYYDILGVSQRATQEEIKKAFRAQMKKWHPDVYGGSSEEEINIAQKTSVKIIEAYKVLSDLSQKQQYDTTLGWENKKTNPQNTTTSKTSSEYDVDDALEDFLNWAKQECNVYETDYYEQLHRLLDLLKEEVELLKEEVINNIKYNQQDEKPSDHVKRKTMF